MGALKRWKNQTGPTLTSAGTNTVTLTYGVSPTAYVRGDEYVFLAGNTNTGAVTIDVNGLGPINVVTADGQTLQGQELQAGQVIHVYYDGTYFRLESVSRQSNIANGYHKMQGGLIFQWGQVTFGGGTSQATTFPMAFAAVFGVFVQVVEPDLQSIFATAGNPSTTGFDCNTSASFTGAVYYFAIGI